MIDIQKITIRVREVDNFRVPDEKLPYGKFFIYVVVDENGEEIEGNTRLLLHESHIVKD